MMIKSIIPKEHGAWAILLIPYFLGISVGAGLTYKAFLALGALVIFFKQAASTFDFEKASYRK